jgi:hypothetical protein
MMGKDFIYFFFDENNNSYYAYGDTVISSASLRPLEFTPDGWKKIQVQNQRNQTYWALDRSFTVPLDCVKDGGQILKYVYYTFGPEAKVFMAVCEQKLFFDATHYGFYYQLVYRGEVDFGNFKHDSTKVNVNIMEGGLPKLIKAFENTKYEIPVDVLEAVDILMDGLALKNGFTYFTLADNYQAISGSLDNRQYLMSFYRLNSEGPVINILRQDVLKQFDNSINYSNDERFFLEALDSISVPVTFKFKGILRKDQGTATARYRIRVIDQTGTEVYSVMDETRTGFPAINEPFDITANTTFNLSTTDHLFLVLNIDVSTVTSNIAAQIDFEETTSSFSYFATHRATTIKALRPLYIFEQLINKITNGAYAPQSTFLQTIQDVTITCGDAIRSLAGSKVKTSLRDFFTSINSDFGVGMGMIGNTLRLEEKSYWIDYTDPIDLGEVSKMKVSCANDLLINNIKIGSPDQDYDDVNGKQEFNNTHEYSAPMTRVQRVLDLVSVYRKDSFGIELTRINLDGKTTTDDKGDNDVFMIHVEDAPRGDGYYHLDRSLNAGATGLLSPSTVFNLYLTPARALARNGDYIRSLFYKLDSRYLTFQTTKKNDQVVAGGVTERADVQLASLALPLFSCNYLEFEVGLKFNPFDILNVSPLKAFKGTWAGWPFVGITNKVSFQSGDYSPQTYQLLAAPTQDFTPLITIDG